MVGYAPTVDAPVRRLYRAVEHTTLDPELSYLGVALLDERLRARDRALRALANDRDQLEEALDSSDPSELLRRYIGRAMAGTRRIDRIFWLRAAADVALDVDEPERRDLLRIAVRHISTSHRVRKCERNAAVRFLLAKAVMVS